MVQMKTRNNTLLVLLLLMASTAFSQKLSKTDLGPMYSEYQFTPMKALVYHTSGDSSAVYMNISLHHFLYRKIEGGKPEASFSVSYRLYPAYNSKSPVEEGTRYFTDSLHQGEEMEMAIDFKIRAPRGADYVLWLRLTDLHDPEHSVITVIDVFKGDAISDQDFFITDENEYPLFDPYILRDQYFKIRCNDPGIGEFIIRYYNRSFPIAKTPFAMDKNVTYTFEPDSFYSISLTGGITPLMELKYPGIYHIQANLANPEGLTLYRFDDGFPDVSSPGQALAPLRYLTTEKEYDRLIAYPDYKVAIDSFWLERASNNPERARNMIKKYYQRVVDVNTLFTSFHEGWKTDRGLVYIIYGPPSEVYRDEEEEEWIYGERGNPMSIRFYFSKVGNPFTNNDFSLQRSPVYKTSWYIAVENWRR